MTDETPNPAEESLVDELLAGRWDPNEILRPVGGDETQREIRRECLEVLGLLAQSLEPRVPSEDLKRGLMAEVTLLGALGAPDASDSSVRPAAPERVNQELEDGLPAARARSERVAQDELPASLDRWREERQQEGQGHQRRRRHRRHRRHRRWMLPVAATMAFFALGLAGWQVFRVAALQRTVVRQAAELEAARLELSEIGDSADTLASAKAKLALLASPGSEFCALKPGRDSRMKLARGTLVMHPDADRWFLKVVGLEPSTEGFRYQTWYLTEGGPVAAAAFGFDSSDAVVEVMASRGPAGVQAVMITLEPLGSEAPSSPALLYGDERMQIL